MSGLPAELQTKLRKAFIAKHAPSELDERGVVMEALSNAVAAADVAAKIAKFAARGRPVVPTMSNVSRSAADIRCLASQKKPFAWNFVSQGESFALYQWQNNPQALCLSMSPLLGSPP
jgi:hypothetical protein